MDVVCIGAAFIDRTFRSQEVSRPATSNPAKSHRGYGGVARNVAENLARLGRHVSLLSAVGDDADGAALRVYAQSAGVDVAGVRIANGRSTGEYVAILEPGGELVVGACDAGPVDAIGASDIAAWAPQLTHARWVFADGNLCPEALAELVALRTQLPFRLAIDGVSASKVLRLPENLASVDVLFINVHQAARLPELPNAAALVLTLGAEGAEVIANGETTRLDALLAQPVDVTGAGDALAAGTLHRLLEGDTLLDAVRGGMIAAALTIESTASVRPDLSQKLLDANRYRI